MEKKFFIALLLAINCYLSYGAGLRRTPRIYNALITTDENLSSSQAYPVIQPTLIDSYNPFGIYNNPFVRLGQPIAPGFYPPQQPHQLPYPYNQFPQQMMLQPPTESAPQASNSSQASKENQPKKDKQQPKQKTPAETPSEKLPIPLNEFGLPPSLIPFQNSVNPSPYNYPFSPHYPPYPNYPGVYNPLTGYHAHNPYGRYLPNPNYPNFYNPQADPRRRPNPFFPTSPTPPTEETTTEEEMDLESTTPNFEDIKNGSKSKNSDVPDVPPPAVPSGAKTNKAT